jgi:hypothetical protein
MVGRVSSVKKASPPRQPAHRVIPRDRRGAVRPPAGARAAKGREQAAGRHDAHRLAPVGDVHGAVGVHCDGRGVIDLRGESGAVDAAKRSRARKGRNRDRARGEIERDAAKALPRVVGKKRRRPVRAQSERGGRGKGARRRGRRGAGARVDDAQAAREGDRPAVGDDEERGICDGAEPPRRVEERAAVEKAAVIGARARARRAAKPAARDGRDGAVDGVKGAQAVVPHVC